MEQLLRHRPGEGVTGHVFQTGKIYETEDLSNDSVSIILPGEAERLKNIYGGISLPLRANENIIGVLHIWLDERRTFTSTEIRLLTAVAEIAGNSLHRARLHEQTLLHDIGKMAVPDSILHKTGPLNEKELATIHLHPQHAHDMLSSISFLHPALDIPYCHHEHWDGSGYPRGLKGEEIPFAARIFSIADVWDALTSDRPYRKAWPKEKTAEYIRENSGKYFDPRVVNVFLTMLPQL